MRTRITDALVLLLIPTVLAAALGVPTADASTISLLADPASDGTFVDYVAAPGEANQFTGLGIQSGRLTVQDGFGAVSITPTDPCTSGQPGGLNEPRFASCPADTLVWVEADLGDGADNGSAGMGYQFPIVLSGGAGPDTLYGGGNDDELYGDAGADYVSGASGDDLLDGGSGADTLIGGNGIDVVDYTGRTAPVTATLDGSTNDGEAGEGDRIENDVEGVAGGSGDDTLTGNDDANSVFGFNGADTISGGGGADILDAGAGDDTVNARDGVADQVDCGDGIDSVTADVIDSVTGCETVLLPGSAPPPSPPPTPALVGAPPPTSTPTDTLPPTVTLRIPRQHLRVALSKGARLRLGMSEAGRVCNSVTLGVRAARRAGLRPRRSETRRGTVTLGSGCVTFTAAGVRTVTLRFTGRAKRAFGKLVTARRTLTVVAHIVATDAAGNRRTIRRQLRLGP